MDFLKNKKIAIPGCAILYFVMLLAIPPKIIGILTMLGVGGIAFYLFAKNEKFKAKGKIFKTLVSLGLAIVFFLFGMGGVIYDSELSEQQKLESAKKAQIETKKKTDEEKAINAAKLKEEEQKKLEEDKKLEEQKKLEEEKKLEEQKKTDKATEPKQDTTNSSNKSSNNTKAVTPTKPKESTTKNKLQETKPEPKGMVWLSKSGKKYHSKPNCGNMDAKNARQIKLSDAQKKNIQSCSKCF
ncbi:hypothetical protein HAHI6034_05855 [Hathewaya histolytica]|uniref:Metallo beta-lactamase family protein n=1 Tax=Hathewaya histolytica TaxID=1498 RepID=A0A4U9RD45_HATHI|nr:hypothetical protein [Hathewaya histolytica]VTQ89644.1 metallo beta-lactamase family protein [Hathewaya histolytica]